MHSNSTYFFPVFHWFWHIVISSLVYQSYRKVENTFSGRYLKQSVKISREVSYVSLFINYLCWLSLHCACMNCFAPHFLFWGWHSSWDNHYAFKLHSDALCHVLIFTTCYTSRDNILAAIVSSTRRSCEMKYIFTRITSSDITCFLVVILALCNCLCPTSCNVYLRDGCFLF